MQQEIGEIVDEVLNIRFMKLTTHPNERVLVAFFGIPGAGKTTVAREVTAILNYRMGKEVAICVGLDGWHYPRAVLDTFPDPEEAHLHRGAPHTFDATSFVHFVKMCQYNPLPQPVPVTHPDYITHPHHLPDPPPSRELPYPTITLLAAPSFSHTLKDPVELSIPILLHHQIIIFEGVYTALKIEPWLAASKEMDLKVLVQVDPEVAKSRLVNRHTASGICKNQKESEERVDKNDLPNGRFALEHSLDMEMIIESRQDAKFSDSGILP